MNFQLWKADNIVLIFACLDLLLGKATLNYFGTENKWKGYANLGYPCICFSFIMMCACVRVSIRGQRFFFIGVIGLLRFEQGMMRTYNGEMTMAFGFRM
jgi:hypothetical protein